MKHVLLTSLLLSVAATSVTSSPLGTAFNYQGRLATGTNAVTGRYDLKCALYDSLAGGSLLAGPVTNAAVGVTNGLFTVTLDFGSVFTGGALWLEMSVRPNGVGAFTLLSPRQSLAPAPYSQYAPNAAAAAIASTVVTGGVTSSMLADGAVTTQKIAPRAVTSTNIDDGGSAAYGSFGVTAQSLAATEVLPFTALLPVTTNGGAPPSFSFTLDGGSVGTPLGFSGIERISEPYQFIVEIISEPGAINPDSANGRQGRFTFTRNGQTTTFAGIVTGCASSSYDGVTAVYTIRMEPALCYLAQNSGYSVYQDIPVPDLVANVYNSLASATLTAALNGSYTPRESATQYGETALNFISRLLEEEGIFYFFQDGAGAPVLVLGDNAGAFPATPYKSLPYYGDLATNVPPGADFVRTFQRSTRSTVRISTVRDYDFEKPGVPVEGTANGGVGRGEDYEFGSPWKTSAELSAQATRRVERYQLERATRSGTGNAADLRAGYTFDLDDRSGAGVGGAYLVTGVKHSGFRRTVQGVTSYFYGNQFEVIPATMPYRPARTAPRPVAQPCPAVVTGPSSEEIYVDKYGRVKVQFYWDRQGALNEQSSAWVRVASPWAGSGHGMLFLPRIGDEVLVDFVHGNPDQPVITGSFYNAVNTVPYALPASKTVSTIKTRSSKGGGGSNEIKFEDAAGSEQLAITAQKDFVLAVKHDTSMSSAHDVTFAVGNDMTLSSAHNLVISAGNSISINATNSPALALSVNGPVGATLFQGSGSGITNLSASALTGTLPDARLSSNVALRGGGNVFSGAQVITSGYLRMSDQGIFFRGGSDINHGLGWFSTGSFAGANPDGPVLFGCSGGGLGSLCSTPYLALTWNNQGNVALDPAGLNAGSLTPGLTFGTAGAEGIASKRTAGGNQFGLDFYTAGTNRMSLTSSGNLGLGTTNPSRHLQIIDSDGLSGSLQVGAAVASSNPKLIYFGDGDFVHIGETGVDDHLEIKATVVSFNAPYVGIGNSSPTNKLMVGTARCDGLSWINASDRNAKENFQPVQGREVLAKVAAIPISRWTYKASDGSAHMGPVAQDFRAAFGLGADDTSIATVDADGVALAAIQGLNEVVKQKDAEIQALTQRLERLEKLVAEQHR